MPSTEDRADFAVRARAVFDEHDGFDDERRLVRADGAVFRGRLRSRAVEPREPSAGTIWIADDVSNSDENPHPLAWAAEHDALTGLVSRAGSGSPRRVRARWAPAAIDRDVLRLAPRRRRALAAHGWPDRR